MLADFFVADASFTGGISVAAYEVNGQARIVTGTGPGAPAQVRVFDAAGGLRMAIDPVVPNNTAGIAVSTRVVGSQTRLVVSQGLYILEYDAATGLRV